MFAFAIADQWERRAARMPVGEVLVQALRSEPAIANGMPRPPSYAHDPCSGHSDLDAAPNRTDATGRGHPAIDHCFFIDLGERPRRVGDHSDDVSKSTATYAGYSESTIRHQAELRPDADEQVPAKKLYQNLTPQASAGSFIYLVDTRRFSSSVQFNTTVKGTDALGPTGVTRRNRLPSAVTSPTTTPGGV